MIRRFYPTGEYASAYAIPYEALYEQGYRGIVFDVDNTLVPHGAPATPEAVALFERLHGMGYETCLISNNQESRVRPFAKAVNSQCVWNAHKPSRKKYREAMAQMGTDVKTTFFVGDQLFTDVYGANRTGMPSYLVKPIHPKEEIQIVLKRYLERLVLWFYRRKSR